MAYDEPNTTSDDDDDDIDGNRDDVEITQGLFFQRNMHINEHILTYIYTYKFISP